MAARAYWKGQIRLALVSIPVEIYSATKSGAAVTFRQIHEPSGKPVKYEKVVPGIGAIDHDDIVKGFELSKGNYVLLDEEEIEAVKLESKRTLELVQFVDTDAIDVLYYTKPYYVVPADELAEEAYIVLREALKRTKKVGLGQLSLRGQEQLVALRPCGMGLVLEVLRYADEVNKAANYFRDVGNSKPDADLLDLAETLIDKKSGAFDASDCRQSGLGLPLSRFKVLHEPVDQVARQPAADQNGRGIDETIHRGQRLAQTLDCVIEPAIYDRVDVRISPLQIGQRCTLLLKKDCKP